MVTHNFAFKLEENVISEKVIGDSPVKWCSVSISDVISRGKRLEASVFDVESKQAYRLIKSGKYNVVNLISAEGPISKAHYGARLKRKYVSKSDNGAIGFIGSSEMLDIKPVPTKYMIDDKNTRNLHVSKGTVLMSRSGTIGNLTLVNNSLSNLLISEHAMRLECREYPGYVYAYLKTKIGQALIRSNIYGAVIQQVEPEHLATIPFPDAPKLLKSRINDLIIRSYSLRDDSNDLLDKATKIMIDELHLPPINTLRGNLLNEGVSVDAFNVKLSKLEGRVDPSYHIPTVGAILNHLSEYASEVTTIGDTRISKEVILPGRFKRVYVDEGYGKVFIGGKQLFELDPSNKKYLSLVHHKDRIAKQLELNENMTLITCSGTIGKVALVGRHWEKWAANQHIIRVVPASEDIAGYLNVFLASSYGYALITRFTYGSVVDEIDDNHVREIPIPILKNQAIQQRINNLALEANAKRYEAYRLEQKAIEIMNSEVIFAK